MNLPERKILKCEVKCRRCGVINLFDWDYTFPLFESQAVDAVDRAKENVIKYSPYNIPCENCNGETIQDLISFL